jgi:hypothetical protein
VLLPLARRRDNGAFAFLFWTIARSPRHRLLLLAIGALGAALALDGMIYSLIRRSDTALLRTSLLLPLLMAFCTNTALRTIYRIPVQWNANWPFRITEDPSARPAQLESIVAGQYWLAAALPLLVALPFQWVTMGIGGALLALPLLFGWMACLIEFTNQRWTRLPFTATFAPGHQPAGVVLVLFLASLGVYGFVGAEIVMRSSANPSTWIKTAPVLLFLWVLFRRSRKKNWGEEPLQFSDDADPAVQVTRFAPE